MERYRSASGTASYPLGASLLSAQLVGRRRIPDRSPTIGPQRLRQAGAWGLREVEVVGQVAGGAVPMGQPPEMPIVLDEPEHARELPDHVVDVPLLRVRRQHEERHPDPEPEPIDPSRR